MYVNQWRGCHSLLIDEIKPGPISHHSKHICILNGKFADLQPALYLYNVDSIQ